MSLCVFFFVFISLCVVFPVIWALLCEINIMMMMMMMMKCNIEGDD